MQLKEILDQYSDLTLDQISSDKVEESVMLRLPRSIIIQEIISALSSLSYVSQAIAPTKPPAYSMVSLLLSAPDHTLPIDGFKEKVFETTSGLGKIAFLRKDLSNNKNFDLYLNILKRAWENNNDIDTSEALILSALRDELGIWDREHYVLEYHPDIIKLWDMNNSYKNVRNYLLNTGLILTYENRYIIAEEVALQIERALGIELNNNSYQRFLSKFSKEQLYNILNNLSLFTSGTKEEQIHRIISSFVPPGEILNTFPVEELREYCRECGIQVSGTKIIVSDNIIEFYKNDGDIKSRETKVIENPLPREPEKRELDGKVIYDIMHHLTNNQLYDILSNSFLPTSGTKEEKVTRLVESPWNERSLLNHLRKTDLSFLCRKIGLNVSGVKEEIIDRIIDESENQFKRIEEEKENLVIEIKEEIHENTDPENKPKEEIIEKPIAVPPNEFKDITAAYPHLDEDEQMILALLKETKSLTEIDIERASIRHNLGWFLTRAHMAEIIAKLKRNSQSPIKVKSGRSLDVYEWIDGNNDDVQLEKKSARDIIDALRTGVVPQNNLDQLIIGQENPRNHLKELLQGISNKKSSFKFIRGQYGAGKTFLCSWLKEYALNNEYVVSFVNIGNDQPLSDLPIFYSGVINGLRTPEKTESGALVDILESWLLNLHREIAQLEGIKAFDQNNFHSLRPIVEYRLESELADLSDIDPGFAPAIRAFYKARITNDKQLATIAISWLSGSRAMSSQSLREINVKGYLEANQVFPRIRALLKLIDGARYRGLMLVVDELETIRRFPHSRQREQALETLRLVVDESGKNGFPGCLILFTGTDEFFEDDRAGLKSYEALYERISSQTGIEGLLSMRQPVIALEGLNFDRLVLVGLKIRDLHSTAYNWEAKNHIPDDAIRTMIKDWTTFGEENISHKPRPVIRDLINIFDICEENPGVNISDFKKTNTFG